MNLLHILNQIVIRLRPSYVGWCRAAYDFYRSGYREEDGFSAIKPQNRFSAWWGAFFREYTSSVEFKQEEAEKR